jgi:hypothetical protein
VSWSREAEIASIAALSFPLRIASPPRSHYCLKCQWACLISCSGYWWRSCGIFIHLAGEHWMLAGFAGLSVASAVITFFDAGITLG